ncbi:MAG: glycosyltransferase family 9 protein [Tannerella sp.]|jgi:ADP-heptose:LPS heptosyltransferase|nr:glycosyltransferase family 9 protein [Tannerella sp.]
MSKILTIRFSAIGDVAMTIPIIYSVAKAYPEDLFTVLTQTFLTPVFMNRPSNVNITGADIANAEKSFWGILRCAFMLRKEGFDTVLDLHGVFRSRIIDAIFFLSGKKIFKIDKGRKQRRQIISRPPKEIHPLRTAIMRYADVFRKAGYDFDETFVSLFENNPVTESFPEEKKGNWIGIAPFAKHKGKIYPLKKMEIVIKQLSEKKDTAVFLFGGQGREADMLKEWSEKYPNVRNAAGCYSIDQELVLISKLDLLVSMDSANMHLASLVETDVVSIWGATHPYAGFYGYRQDPDNAVQAVLPCRPCSIFGNKPCYREDYACMNEIVPEQIVHKVKDFLYK